MDIVLTVVPSSQEFQPPTKTLDVFEKKIMVYKNDFCSEFVTVKDMQQFEQRECIHISFSLHCNDIHCHMIDSCLYPLNLHF